MALLFAGDVEHFVTQPQEADADTITSRSELRNCGRSYGRTDFRAAGGINASPERLNRKRRPMAACGGWTDTQGIGSSMPLIGPLWVAHKSEPTPSR